MSATAPATGTPERVETTFPSGGERCAAWHYAPPGHDSGTCVVMAHGFSLTRHDGLAPYAEAFAAAGAHVLVFDHRYLGDSGGMPRQRFRRGAQLEDWRSAVAFARTLDGVRADRIVLWGFSFSGGHVVTLAAGRDDIAATIALCPFLDGLWRAITTPPRVTAWVVPRAIADAAGRDTLIPVTGQPGTRAAMAFAGEADGFARAVPAGSPWRNEISPAIFLTIAAVRPVARAAKVHGPLWVGLGERDVSVHNPAVERLAERAPRGELHRYDADHFDPFVGDLPGRIAADQVAFLAANGLL
jgi:uncharacterized protein